MLLTQASTCGRPRNADRALRDAALIQVAAHLFIEHGFAKVSLKLIATEAKVAARTIYLRYGGKLGLFEAVVIAERDQLLAQLSALKCSDASFESFLRQFCHGYLALINSDRVVAALRMVVAESTQVPQLAQTFYDAGPGAMRRHLAEIFTQPGVRPLFRPELSPESLSILLLAMLLEDPVARLLSSPPKQACPKRIGAAIANFLAIAQVFPAHLSR